MKLDREAKIAEMSMAEFNSLPEYSRSLPTGTTQGKVWKRHVNWNKPEESKEWWLGEYGEHTPIADRDGEASVAIHWYYIAITVESLGGS